MDFKDYIFKTLRWPLCLRPGPIAAVAHGLARVFNDVVGDMYWLRDQFNPATCELEFLEPLAESRGIIRHRLETDDDKFRARVVKAFAWQLLGGKSQGMPKLLAHFGYEVDEPVNVRAEDETKWAEFKIKCPQTKAGLVQDDYDLMGWAINESKPARSKLAAIQVTAETPGTVYVGGIVNHGRRIKIYPHFELSGASASVSVGGGIRFARIRKVFPADVGPQDVAPANVYISGVMHVVRRRTVRSV